MSVSWWLAEKCNGLCAQVWRGCFGKYLLKRYMLSEFQKLVQKTLKFFIRDRYWDAWITCSMTSYHSQELLMLYSLLLERCRKLDRWKERRIRRAERRLGFMERWMRVMTWWYILERVKTMYTKIFPLNVGVH